MKTRLIISAILFAVAPVLADEAAYLQDGNGLVNGPYRFAEGETVRVGTETATVVKPTARKLALQKKLLETVPPSVRFQEADVRDVVKSLQKLSGQHVPAGLPRGEVELSLDLAEYAMAYDDLFGEPKSTKPPLITFSARYVPLIELIKTVAEIAGLDFKLNEDSVALFPKWRKTVQQDESTVPSKAAPSASSTVR